MDKVYNHQEVEDKIYSFWEKGGWFTPKIEPGKKPFVITLPPPNVTGSLHAGHTMFVIEDIMARYHRMKGDPTLWLPGFDHASIAVEYLVAKRLKKEGISKRELGREEFLKCAHRFANDSKKYIRQQLKKTGFSLDWSREAYTMDKKYSQAVKEAFKQLQQKDLIYQDEYLVNWCPNCQTVISDLENEHREEKGQLYYIKYGPMTIATTRPETMFADVAVAIHPENKKYAQLIGKKVPLPLTDRQIPVIADKAVDPEFGTGALKITPAHDPTDFEIGQRHNLKNLIAINPQAKLTKLAGRFADLPAEQTRPKVVAELKKQGFLVKIKAHVHAVGHCQRCGTTTEPMISQQWFVKTKPLAKKAIAAVKNGQIKIVPKRFEKTYFHWLENIRDWCISRQLWWGHQIPIENETDILDTWFSSSLWPIATLGWPQKTKDFDYFYPTTVRETAYDILFFWVAREIMMCLALTDQVPFKVVYLHGLVRDEKGRKFSKTTGVGFDPLEMIKKYGADALRMGLIAGNAPGRDLKIDEKRIIGYRNFTNKIWNAARFILMNREDSKIQRFKDSKTTHPDDKWIIKKLDKTTKSVTRNIENYRFDLAAEEIYQFFWHTFCDQYIEKAKKRRDEAQPVLLHVLATSLKLLHPFMPFITEEIYQKLSLDPARDKPALMIKKWPLE